MRVFAELWGETVEGPFAIELIYQGEHGPIVFMEVPIKQKEEDKVTRIYHCGNCGTLVHSHMNRTDPVAQVELYLQGIYRGQNGN